MTQSAGMSERIEGMFALDRLMALAITLGMWLAIGVVYFAVDHMMIESGVRTALAIAAALVLLFNTASILAMLNHYAHDKEFIYGIDIRHLDEARAGRD